MREWTNRMPMVFSIIQFVFVLLCSLIVFIQILSWALLSSLPNWGIGSLLLVWYTANLNITGDYKTHFFSLTIFFQIIQILCSKLVLFSNYIQLFIIVSNYCIRFLDYNCFADSVIYLCIYVFHLDQIASLLCVFCQRSFSAYYIYGWISHTCLGYVIDIMFSSYIRVTYV